MIKNLLKATFNFLRNSNFALFNIFFKINYQLKQLPES